MPLAKKLKNRAATISSAVKHLGEGVAADARRVLDIVDGDVRRAAAVLQQGREGAAAFIARRAPTACPICLSEHQRPLCVRCVRQGSLTITLHTGVF